MRPIPPSRPPNAKPVCAGSVKQGRRPPLQRPVLDRPKHAGNICRAGAYHLSRLRNACRVSKLLVAEQAEESRAGAIEIALPNGSRVSVDAFVNEKALSRVLRAMKAST